MQKTLATVLLAAIALPAWAGTGIYAPVDRPGPALSPKPAALAASLTCSGDLTNTAFEPVLLVPGTASTPHTAFSWNKERAFRQQGRPFCAVTLPDNALNDISVAGEYVVNAIRTMYASDGNRPIGILGWSQGGMVPRWALRFWPDTRKMVADMIGIDPSNHGTLDAVATCLATRSCAPAIWQQATGAHFLQALNSGAETFGGIAYTTVYSRLDEVVVPNFDAKGSSSLHGGQGQIVNVAAQRICPTDTSEHVLMGTTDPVAYALALSALDNPGPADPSTIPASVCLEVVQPGVDKLTAAAHLAALNASIPAAVAKAPTVSAEPAVPAYVYR
jgi:triacylglycerol esterase/lipase EstA (alpha/beta hydrolase family)